MGVMMTGTTTDGHLYSIPCTAVIHLEIVSIERSERGILLFFYHAFTTDFLAQAMYD